MEEALNQITQLVGAYIPHLLGALLILTVGWLVALIGAAAVQGGLRRAGLGT